MRQPTTISLSMTTTIYIFILSCSQTLPDKTDATSTYNRQITDKFVCLIINRPQTDKTESIPINNRSFPEFGDFCFLEWLRFGLGGMTGVLFFIFKVVTFGVIYLSIYVSPQKIPLLIHYGFIKNKILLWVNRLLIGNKLPLHCCMFNNFMNNFVNSL